MITYGVSGAAEQVVTRGVETDASDWALVGSQHMGTGGGLLHPPHTDCGVQGRREHQLLVDAKHKPGSHNAHSSSTYTQAPSQHKTQIRLTQCIFFVNIRTSSQLTQNRNPAHTMHILRQHTHKLPVNTKHKSGSHNAYSLSTYAQAPS